MMSISSPLPAVEYALECLTTATALHGTVVYKTKPHTETTMESSSTLILADEGTGSKKLSDLANTLS